jgi:hypothetical protein
MSVTSETSSVEYSGNNSTVVAYVVPFLFYKAQHLEVVAIDDEGEETLLELTSDFTVTGEADEDGGTLTTVEAWDNTHTIRPDRRSRNLRPIGAHAHCRGNYRSE